MRPIAVFLVMVVTAVIGLQARYAPAAEAVPAGAVPNYFDPGERLPQPDISGFARIRFLTTTDFPPFNFIDQTGRLAGFNVDLARAICEELDVVAKCEIQALPWDDLQGALDAGQGEAIIAGLAITGATRARYAFSRSYLQFPARFVRNEKAAIPGNTASALFGRQVGVVAGSAHQAMLGAFFPKIRAKPFDSESAMLGALKENTIEAAFGDGTRLSFWLSSKAADRCCAFFDGPYLSERFLGQGLAIATLKTNRDLVLAFDHALLTMSRNGHFAEIFRRYFPISPY